MSWQLVDPLAGFRYQRSRQHSQNDPSDASDRIAEELPDINEHMHTVVSEEQSSSVISLQRMCFYPSFIMDLGSQTYSCRVKLI